MANFNDFWEDLKKGLSTLAESGVKDFKDQILTAGNKFLEQSKDDIKLWTEQLAEGQMNKDDFGSLIRGKKDVAEMILLEEKGLAKAQVDKLTSGLLDVVVSTAVKSFI